MVEGVPGTRVRRVSSRHPQQKHSQRFRLCICFFIIFFLLLADSMASGVHYEDLDQPAWWRVDLGREYDIYQVIIYNRNERRGLYIFFVFLCLLKKQAVQFQAHHRNITEKC